MVKVSTDVEIKSLLDIKIQQEVPLIQSPTLLNVLVYVIPEQPVPTPYLILTTETPALMVPPPPPIVSAISSVQQQTTSIPTPPTITIAPSITTIVPDSLPSIVQRVYVLEKDVKELKQVDHSLAILAMIRSQVPSAVNEYLGSILGDSLQKMTWIKLLLLWVNLLNLRESMTIKKNTLLLDQMKGRTRKDTQPSKKSSASKESTKGNTPPKSSKFGKFVTTEEPDEEHMHDMSIDAKENIVDEMGNVDEHPDGDAALKNDWFKQPPRPLTLDPKWNKCQVVDNQPEQIWFNDLVSSQKVPLIIDELMAIPIDFSKFAKNRLKLDKITKVDLENHEGDRCPFDLNKPLLLKGRPSHLTATPRYFFNNDLEYLKSTDSERKYTTSITKMKATRYELVGIEDMILKQWSETKVGYDKDVEHGIKHWGPKHQLLLMCCRVGSIY
ncbi:hypothetical protein Tco_0008134 [Tanacetum coccineum]